MGCICRWGAIVEQVTYWGKGSGEGDRGKRWAVSQAQKQGSVGKPVLSLAGCVTSGRPLSLSDSPPLFTTDQLQHFIFKIGHSACQAIRVL